MIKVTKKCNISPKELKIGTKIEFEHTNSKKRASTIASQHICEFPQYYSKGLIPMEKQLKKSEVPAGNPFIYDNNLNLKRRLNK